MFDRTTGQCAEKAGGVRSVGIYILGHIERALELVPDRKLVEFSFREVRSCLGLENGIIGIRRTVKVAEFSSINGGRTSSQQVNRQLSFHRLLMN